MPCAVSGLGVFWHVVCVRVFKCVSHNVTRIYFIAIADMRNFLMVYCALGCCRMEVGMVDGPTGPGDFGWNRAHFGAWSVLYVYMCVFVARRASACTGPTKGCALSISSMQC